MNDSVHYFDDSYLEDQMGTDEWMDGLLTPSISAHSGIFRKAAFSSCDPDREGGKIGAQGHEFATPLVAN